ncbi:Osteoclast-stimulating factor 1 [Entophlyctis sp. JEL0112]|nr:Osteoclast-stimulating factor 1 [Entophlyctis sp. JEL0112]
MSAPPPRPSRPGKKEIAVVEAKYAYSAQNADELSFEEGDDDAGWWKCRCGDSEGLVPANYGLSPRSIPIVRNLIRYIGSGRKHHGNRESATWWETGLKTRWDYLAAAFYCSRNTTFVSELLAAGVSVNGLDKAGNTALHWAARSGKTEVVRMLLEKSPALNAKNKLGDTALHNAAWGGHLAVVSLLLSQPDIQANLKNNDGATPRSLAKTDEVAALLIQFLDTSTDVPGDEDDSD